MYKKNHLSKRKILIYVVRKTRGIFHSVNSNAWKVPKQLLGSLLLRKDSVILCAGSVGAGGGEGTRNRKTIYSATLCPWTHLSRGVNTKPRCGQLYSVWRPFVILYFRTHKDAFASGLLPAKIVHFVLQNWTRAAQETSRLAVGWGPWSHFQCTTGQVGPRTNASDLYLWSARFESLSGR
jgi:hypothetical protein